MTTHNALGRIFGTALWYTACILLAVVFAGPFVWMVSNAFKPQNEIFADPPILISEHATFDNFRDVFKQAPFERYMLNSFIVAGSVTVVALLLHAMAPKSGKPYRMILSYDTDFDQIPGVRRVEP